MPSHRRRRSSSSSDYSGNEKRRRYSSSRGRRSSSFDRRRSVSHDNRRLSHQDRRRSTTRDYHSEKRSFGYQPSPSRTPSTNRERSIADNAPTGIAYTEAIAPAKINAKKERQKIQVDEARLGAFKEMARGLNVSQEDRATWLNSCPLVNDTLALLPIPEFSIPRNARVRVADDSLIHIHQMLLSAASLTTIADQFQFDATQDPTKGEALVRAQEFREGLHTAIGSAIHEITVLRRELAVEARGVKWSSLGDEKKAALPGEEGRVTAEGRTQVLFGKETFESCFKTSDADYEKAIEKFKKDHASRKPSSSQPSQKGKNNGQYDNKKDERGRPNFSKAYGGKKSVKKARYDKKK